VFLFNIIDEVGDGDWGFVLVEFEDDIAMVRFEADLGGGGFGGFFGIGENREWSEQGEENGEGVFHRVNF
jgi:hypothetical protein